MNNRTPSSAWPTANTPLINTAPPPAVPWDPAELKGRDCGHCACFFEQANPENPAQSQGFCRRAPAEVAQMRVMEPRVLNGVPQMKDGQPVMQPGTAIGFIYRLTKREGTCFDGWRPLGTLPGEPPTQAAMKAVVASLRPVLEKLSPDVQQLLTPLLGLDPVPPATGKN